MNPKHVGSTIRFTENHNVNVSKKRIPLFKGRPNRDTAINGDDILNLKILLETETNFETFLKKI